MSGVTLPGGDGFLVVHVVYCSSSSKHPLEDHGRACVEGSGG